MVGRAKAMAIRFSCASCGKRFAVSDDRAGRTAKCPQCQASLTIPELDRPPALLLPGEQSVNDPFADFKAIEAAAAAGPRPKASVSTPTVTEPAKPPVAQPADWYRVFKFNVGMVACVIFLATVNSPPSPWVLVHYACLMAILWYLSQWILGRFKCSANVARWGGIAFVTMVVFYYFSRCDVYPEHWESEDGTRYTDWYQRFQGGPTHRSLSFDGVYGSGPMKGEGKRRPHGMWTVLGKDLSLEKKFYWYGEEVSEGEWHLRNK
jgi:hypothetical protein